MARSILISEATQRRFGALRIAYLLASQIVVSPTPPRLKKRARGVEADIRSRWTATSVDDEPIISSWIALAEAMGLIDDGDLPANVSLIHRILSNRDIPKINAVVDAANVTAATFRCPVGVFDSDKLIGNILLRGALGGERMLPLMSDSEVIVPAGEIVYADEEGIFSRYSKDAHRSRVTETTINLLAVIDGSPTTPLDHILQAREFLQSLLRDIGGPDVQIETGLSA